MSQWAGNEFERPVMMTHSENPDFVNKQEENRMVPEKEKKRKVCKYRRTDCSWEVKKKKMN